MKWYKNIVVIIEIMCAKWYTTNVVTESSIRSDVSELYENVKNFVEPKKEKDKQKKASKKKKKKKENSKKVKLNKHKSSKKKNK